MATISKEMELEAPSGYLFSITAEGSLCHAEPDIGIFGEWIDGVTLIWTKTGEALSATALRKLPAGWREDAERELMEYHFNH